MKLPLAAWVLLVVLGCGGHDRDAGSASGGAAGTGVLEPSGAGGVPGIGGSTASVASGGSGGRGGGPASGGATGIGGSDMGGSGGPASDSGGSAGTAGSGGSGAGGGGAGRRGSGGGAGTAGSIAASGSAGDSGPAGSSGSNGSGGDTGAGGVTSGGTGSGGAVGGSGGVESGGTGGSAGALTGPITVSGRQVLIGGTPIELRGVCWNPVPKGADHPAGLDYAGLGVTDIPLMRAAGINVVRTYEPIRDRQVLDSLFAAGIRVAMTVYAWGGAAASEAATTVNAVKDHPAILMWLVGNEWNYNGMYTGLSFDDALARVNEVTAVVKQNDTAHPVGTVYGELPAADVLARLSSIDVWGLNVYRGISFGALFSDWSARSDKPMFVSEYGADAFDARIPGPNLEAQALADESLTQEILAESAATGGVCLGGTIFEFADEWWKAGAPSTHEEGGSAPGGGPYPDATFNEEWWGIVDIDRNARPAYTALADLWLAR